MFRNFFRRKYVAIIAVVAVGVALAIGSFALAETVSPAQPAPGARLTRLAQRLQLTPDQQTQARAIFQGMRQQVQQVLTPQQRQTMQNRRDHFRSTLRNLKLTADQRAQMRTIRRNARTQAQAIKKNTALSAADRRTQLHTLRQDTRNRIKQILTPAQQSIVQATAAQARQQRGAMHGLRLTKNQHQQIRAIRQQAMEHFRAILTPAQQAQFDQMNVGRRMR